MNADKPDRVFFDRLDDRAYQPVNIQPFGQYATISCRQARSVGGLDAVSQSQPQFYQHHYICVHLRASLLQRIFSQDERR